MTARQRDPRIRHLLRWFDCDTMPAGQPHRMSALCLHMATEAVRNLGDGEELITGLRKLLEAKDAFVRQAAADGEEKPRKGAADGDADLRCS